MARDDPDSDAGVSETMAPSRAWRRPGTSQSTGEDDGVIPLDDLHLHRYCAVYPFTPDDDPEYLSSEAYAAIVDDHDDAGDVPGERARFLTGFARHSLRHTPMAVLITTIVLFVGAEFADGVEGISALLPVLSPVEWFVVAVGVLLYGLLLSLVLNVGLFDVEEMYKATVVYGLISILALGTLVSMYFVFRYTAIQADPAMLLDGGETMTGRGEVPNNIVFVSGYLLVILLGGLFIYDGLLRTEFLIENLDRTGIIENKAGYAHWKQAVRDRLSHTVGERWNPFHDSFPIRTAYAFSAVFLTQYAVYWTVGRGPQNLDFALTTAANLAINFFLVVVAFQFVVLVASFYWLLNEDRNGLPFDEATDGGSLDADSPDGGSLDADSPDGGSLDEDSPDGGSLDEESPDEQAVDRSPDDGRILGYKPGHVDGHGGYRDLGKFATRVNLLLILGGFYLVYRLFFQGSRVAPVELVPEGIHVAFGVTIWFQSFLAPVLLYGFVALGWIYYSFWQIHLRMLRERERHYLDRTNTLDDLSQWSLRQSAPVWPIDSGMLWSLVTGTFGPILIYVLEVA